MGLFGTKSELVKLWQKVKKDGEKARGGGKPGGKMGFEDLLETLDKALKSKDPKPESIRKQIADLSKKMASYIGGLNQNDEKVFIAGIKSFIQTLNELDRGLILIEKDFAEEDQKMRSARIMMIRTNQLSAALEVRLKKIKEELASFNCVLGDPTVLVAKAKEIQQLQKEMSAVGVAQGDAVEYIMKNS